MKSPKLLCSITLFLLFQLTAVKAQVLTVPKLNSYFRKHSNLPPAMQVQLHLQLPETVVLLHLMLNLGLTVEGQLFIL